MKKVIKTGKRLMVLFLLVLTGLATLLGGCQREQSQNRLSGSVRIAGSSTVYPITVAIVEEFNRQHPAVEIPIQSTGTGGGFSNFFIPGNTDINNASRPITPEERQAALAKGFEPLELQVAVDAITVVVNPEAEWVNNLTVEQLAYIWRPENPAQTWRDIDPAWPGDKIELFGPTAASGTFDFFTEVILGETGRSRSDYQGTELDNTIVQAVAGNRFALGYFGLAYYLENREQLKSLSINGVMPAIETARSGRYQPLSRPLYVYVNSNSLNRPEVREFVRFYIRQTSTGLIDSIGYVPLTETAMNVNLDKLEQVIGTLR